MIIYQKLICRPDLRANPDVFYLFGDNEQRVGLGGQAREMRGEPNAVGIRTKKRPGMDQNDFWSDQHFDLYCKLIDEDFHPVYEAIRVGHLLVVPLDGLGTGLSALPTVAPRLLAHINGHIRTLGAYC
jgi:hypothetical protein